MRTASDVIADLRARGELWEPAPGCTALRRDALRLYRQLERALTALTQRRAEAWTVPGAVPLDVLARADYFASFPQWLTGACQLAADERVLADIAASDDAAIAAARGMVPTCCALQPAVCYHVYAALAGSRIEQSRHVAVGGTCWRREAEYQPLERAWSFTMREQVCVGTAAEVEAFRQRGSADAVAFARQLGLEPRIAAAEDPFFAPSTRGRALLQRIKALKQELLLPLGGGREVAAASFNNHEQFFGRSFDIQLADGTAAASACAAYGVERWLLAYLVQHGTLVAEWPAQGRIRPMKVVA